MRTFAQSCRFNIVYLLVYVVVVQAMIKKIDNYSIDKILRFYLNWNIFESNAWLPFCQVFNCNLLTKSWKTRLNLMFPPTILKKCYFLSKKFFV